jgi:molecular chaperone DnaJ
VIGGDVEVPTLTGKAKLAIDPGTPAGRMLRMREHGIPHLNSYGRGDQLVRINVWIPTKMNSKEKELLRALSSCEHVNPSEEDLHMSDRTFFDKVKDVFS